MITLGRKKEIPEDTVLCKWYDAPVVCIVRLDHKPWILQADGTPCLYSANPGMRDAHWWLHSKCYNGPMSLNRVKAPYKFIPEGWMMAGFWCVNARSEIYNVETPFLTFAVGDGETACESHDEVCMWAATMDVGASPRIDLDPKLKRAVSYRSNGETGNVSGYDLCGLDFDNSARYRTDAMPYGLVQHQIPFPFGKQNARAKHSTMLHSMGLNY